MQATVFMAAKLHLAAQVQYCLFCEKVDHVHLLSINLIRGQGHTILVSSAHNFRLHLKSKKYEGQGHLLQEYPAHIQIQLWAGPLDLGHLPLGQLHPYFGH